MTYITAYKLIIFEKNWPFNTCEFDGDASLKELSEKKYNAENKSDTKIIQRSDENLMRKNSVVYQVIGKHP